MIQCYNDNNIIFIQHCFPAVLFSNQLVNTSKGVNTFGNLTRQSDIIIYLDFLAQNIKFYGLQSKYYPY